MINKRGDTFPLGHKCCALPGRDQSGPYARPQSLIGGHEVFLCCIQFRPNHNTPAYNPSLAAARAARTFYTEMASRDELCGHYHQFEMAIVAGAGMAEVVVAETVAEVGVLGEVVGPTQVVDSVEAPVGFAFPMAAARVVVELGVVVVGIPDSRAAEVVEAAGSRTVEVVEAADSNLVEMLEVEVA